MECSSCKKRKQVPLKRCKHFELGGDKKRKASYKWNMSHDTSCDLNVLSSPTGTNDPVLKTFITIISFS